VVATHLNLLSLFRKEYDLFNVEHEEML